MRGCKAASGPLKFADEEEEELEDTEEPDESALVFISRFSFSAILLLPELLLAVAAAAAAAAAADMTEPDTCEAIKLLPLNSC